MGGGGVDRYAEVRCLVSLGEGKRRRAQAWDSPLQLCPSQPKARPTFPLGGQTALPQRAEDGGGSGLLTQHGQMGIPEGPWTGVGCHLCPSLVLQCSQ